MRQAGHRLGPGFGAKVKGIALTTTIGSIGTFDWTYLKPQIDAIASLGANCVKLYYVFPAGIAVGSSAWNIQKGLLNMYLDYCLSKNLMVFGGLLAPYPKSAYTSANFVAGLRDWAATLGGYPNVICFDAFNEINVAANGYNLPAAGAIWVSFVKSVVQSVSNIPVSASISVNLKSDLSGAWVAAIAPVSDYIDYHFYYNYNSNTPGEIMLSDITVLRSNSWWKPFIVGEGSAQTWQTARRTPVWNSMGRAAELADSYGAVAFITEDFGGTGAYAGGMFNTDLSERHDVTDPFRNWSGWQ